MWDYIRRTGLRAGACVETSDDKAGPQSSPVAPAFGLVRVLKQAPLPNIASFPGVAPAFGLVRVLKQRAAASGRHDHGVAPAFGLVRVLKPKGEARAVQGHASHRPSGWCVC